MPGVHHTSGGEVALELAVHAHTLQRAFHLRLVVIRKDVVDALGRIPVVQRGLFRVYAAHHAGHIQKIIGSASARPVRVSAMVLGPIPVGSGMPWFRSYTS